jgi:hypothetical protein
LGEGDYYFDFGPDSHVLFAAAAAAAIKNGYFATNPNSSNEQLSSFVSIESAEFRWN